MESLAAGDAGTPADAVAESPSAASRVPAVRIDARGKRRVDYRAVLALAGPLFVNSALQAVLSLTDTWFIGRLSVQATAAMGATFFLVLVFILLIGGVGLAVQTVAAQAFGAGRLTDAAKAVWTGLYAGACVAPLFIVLAFSGHAILAPFRLDATVEALAVEYWFPRLVGAPVGVVFWSVSGFFNGIGRTKVTLILTLGVAVANALLNQLFMFEWGLGMAGSAWATSVSLLLGAIGATSVFLAEAIREDFQCTKVWHFDAAALRRLFALGVPMGLFATVDLVGWALFQLMLTRLGPVEGAATQIVMMITSAAFYPALGLSMAATTLVGQSIGAGDKDWARRLGNTAIRLAVAYMGGAGLLLAILGPWLVPVFTSPADPNAATVVGLGGTLLWVAACYQVFDALNMGASFCLRGAGDVRAPTVALLFLSWFGFVPLSHVLTFAPGEGLVDFLPGLGYGAVGGWVAAVLYVTALGLLLLWRWHSGAWRKMQLLG